MCILTQRSGVFETFQPLKMNGYTLKVKVDPGNLEKLWEALMLT